MSKIEELARKAGIEYPLRYCPELEEIAKDELARRILAYLLDAEAHIGEGVWRTRYQERIYKYRFPRVVFRVYTRRLTEGVARNIFCAKAWAVKKEWETEVGGSRAIAILLVVRPYATKFKDRIEEILNRYRERPARRIE
jgi:hypothetical protein